MLDLGYEGVRSGVRGYQIRGTRVSDPGYDGIIVEGITSGYEGIRSGVRGHQIRGTRALDPGHEGIRVCIRAGVRRGLRGRANRDRVLPVEHWGADGQKRALYERGGEGGTCDIV